MKIILVNAKLDALKKKKAKLKEEIRMIDEIIKRAEEKK